MPGSHELTVVDGAAGAGRRDHIVPTGTPTTNTDWDDATNSPIDPFAEQFERRAITAIDGNTLSFAALAYDHAEVDTGNGPRWTAEVANLSRNVRVEGTEGGRAHIFIRSQLRRSCATRGATSGRAGPGRRNACSVVRAPFTIQWAARAARTSRATLRRSRQPVFVPHMLDGVMFLSRRLQHQE